MQKILLIQMLAMGDLLLTTPLLAGLKTKYPDAQVHVLANSLYSRIMKPSPSVDEFIELPLTRLYELANQAEDQAVPGTLAFLAAWIEKIPHDFDLIINPCFNDMGGALGFLIRSSRLIGAALTREGYLIFRGDWPACVYTHVHGPSLNPFHLADAHCLAVGVRPLKPGLYFHLTNEELLSARQFLSTGGVSPDDRIVALHVGAGLDYRRWPEEGFIRVGRSLQEEGFRILLTGSKAELRQVTRVAQSIGPKTIVAAGRTDLGMLAGLLEHCQALASNDTGPIHLAAALGVPCVSIFLGKAQFRATGPYGTGHLVIEAGLDCAPCENPTACSHLRCREVITPEDVLAGMKHVMGEPLHRPAGSRARFRQAFISNDGWLDWKLITPDPKAGIISAYRQVWLSALDPGPEMKAPAGKLPPPPQKEPFSQFDLLSSRAVNTARMILSKLEGNALPSELQQDVQKLSQVSEKIKELGFNEELLKPMATYYVLRLAGLDSTEPIKLVRDQLNLYLKVQALVRLLAEKLS
ncbi:MAG: glycosyltransferase family 9 protein [Deltaproteobacteria bacterium]|nr:glycosyltransferase family 9 protein [Deltaproteobacteria bacterium]